MFPGLRSRPLAKNVSAARDALAPVLGNSGGQSFRSRIANGNFAINQRVVAGTVILAAGVYGHDRWKAGASGCTYTFAANGLDTVITILSGTLLQVVPAAKVEGGAYVASWAGSAQGRIGSGPFGASGLVATGVVAAANLNLEFGVGTLGLVQLSPGTIATPFDRADPDFEVYRCMRRFQAIKGTAPIAPGGWTQSATAAVGFCLRFPRMASAPTVTSSNGTYTVFDGSINANVTTLAVTFATEESLGFDIAVAGGMTASRPATLYVSTGALWLSAEL